MTVRKNTLWSLAGSGLPLLAAVPAIPFLIHALGGERFSVLTLIWALIGYLGLFDFGLGRGLTVQLGRLQNAGEVRQASVLAAGISVVAATGLMGGLAIYLLAEPLATSWLKIDPALQTEAADAFRTTGFGVLATVLANGFRGAMEGLNQFRSSSTNKMLSGVFQFATPCLAVWLFGDHLTGICITLVVARWLLVLMAMYQLRALLRVRPAFVKSDYSDLFDFGIWATISSVVSPVMVYGDRFIVGGAVNAAAVGFYSVPQEALQRLLILPAALSAALLARFSSVSPAQAWMEYKFHLKRITVIHGVLCGLAAVCVYPILYAWISPDFAQNALAPSLILALGVWLNGIAHVPYSYLNAQVATRSIAIVNLAELVFFLVLSWTLTREFGISGAAAAWTVRVGFDLLVLSWIANAKNRQSCTLSPKASLV